MADAELEGRPLVADQPECSDVASGNSVSDYEDSNLSDGGWNSIDQHETVLSACESDSFEENLKSGMEYYYFLTLILLCLVYHQ